MKKKAELKKYFDIKRTEYIDEKLKKISDKSDKEIFIPTHGNNGIQYLYYIAPQKGLIVKWSVNVHGWVSYLKQIFVTNGLIEEKNTDNTIVNRLIYSSMVLHSITYSYNKRCVYIFPISGNFVLCLHLDSCEYEILIDDIYKIFCPTNNIYNDFMYYTCWDIRDSTKRKSTYDSIPLSIHRYDINKGEATAIKTIQGPDTIHQTYYNPALHSLLCVEMPVFLQVPLNNNTPSPDHLIKVVQNGVCSSRLIHFDLEKHKTTELFADKGPAHITPACNDPNTVFISCCNMSAASCFGNGRIDKYHCQNGFSEVVSYEDKDLFRIPSVSSFIWENEHLLCTAVYPNQVHIINADTMQIKVKFLLSDYLTVPDFSKGPYQYPNYDKTPYTILPISGSPYIILSTIWSIRIMDIRTGKIIEKFNYNKERDPLVTTGHSILLSIT